MAKIKMRSGLKSRKVVNEAQWLKARTAFLKKEKKFTKARDQINRERRALPWLKVAKDYVFEGPDGKVSFEELFAGKSQLIVYHFMFGPGWKAGCPHCSFWTDSYNGNEIHLAQKDTAFVLVSRATLNEIASFKARMGWSIPWYSSNSSEFNYDFRASFTDEDVKKGKAYFNFEMTAPGVTEREGASTFYRDEKGDIYLTYQTFARGIDLLNTAYNLLDLTARGRDEDPEDPQDWVKFHDKY